MEMMSLNLTKEFQDVIFSRSAIKEFQESTYVVFYNTTTNLKTNKIMPHLHGPSFLYYYVTIHILLYVQKDERHKTNNNNNNNSKTKNKNVEEKRT